MPESTSVGPDSGATPAGPTSTAATVERTTHPRLPDHFRLPFAEDIDGVWHVRRDDFWDNDAGADVRAHAACGKDIWSGHVSAYPPIMGDEKARHCRGCFPTGRKPRGR